MHTPRLASLAKARSATDRPGSRSSDFPTPSSYPAFSGHPARRNDLPLSTTRSRPPTKRSITPGRRAAQTRAGASAAPATRAARGLPTAHGECSALERLVQSPRSRHEIVFIGTADPRSATCLLKAAVSANTPLNTVFRSKLRAPAPLKEPIEPSLSGYRADVHRLAATVDDPARAVCARSGRVR